MMDDRAALKPVLPLADATTSYWQRHPSPIASLRTTAGLPRSADIVIVGSGISGACIAYYALAKWPSEKVVMLEARTACSGATGRNGELLFLSLMSGFITDSRLFRWPHKGSVIQVISTQCPQVWDRRSCQNSSARVRQYQGHARICRDPQPAMRLSSL